MDTPGAVIEGMVELVGQRAGGAEPPGVQVPLVAAPRAVDPMGFIAGSTDRAGHSVTGKHPVAAITAVRAVGVRLTGTKSLSASPASRGPNLSPIHTPTEKITSITAVSRRDDHAAPAL